MEEPEVKHLKSLEDDNARFKKLPAEAMLDNEALQMALAKSINDRSEAGSRGGDMLVNRSVATSYLQTHRCVPVDRPLSARA